MASTTANGITIEYKTHGDNTADPMLLVMGFGAQLVYWASDFLDQLAAKGFFVIVYDNRDVGLSTKFDDPQASLPALDGAFDASAIRAPYTVADMAADGIGLLTALGIERAHIVGASMGGFIVQSMAIDYPARVRSLCSIMSSTGDPTVPPATPEAMAALVQAPATTRDEAIDQALRTARVVGSPGFPFAEERVRERAETSFDRCFHPAGRVRQALAVAASPDRTADLAAVDVPTVVIHGADDPLVSPVGGEATAKAIPGAELVIIAGMGHDLPEGAWPTIIDAIATNAAKAAD